MNEALEALSVLFKDKQDHEYIEVRALRHRGPPVLGYYNDLEQCAERIAQLDVSGDFKGIYANLNARVTAPPVFNGTCAGKSAINDSDITEYHWFWLDFDAMREDKHSAANDAELSEARNTALQALKWLREQGWPKPLLAMSGNGYHALWPTNLKNEQSTVELYQTALNVIRDRFGDSVDNKIFNPSRICRLYGTHARKGDATKDRPHRKSRLLNVEEARSPVTLEQISYIAAQKLDEKSGEAADAKLSKLIDWMKENYPNAIGPKQYMDGGRKWVFPICPWNEDHRDNSAFVVRFPSGAVIAGCLHESCQGAVKNGEGKLIGWRSLQEMCGKPLGSRNSSQMGPSTDQAPGRTDLGNAKRMVNLYGEDMRWVPETGKWIFWDDKRWEQDTNGRILRRAAGTAAAIFAQAGSEPDPDEAREWRKWAVKSEGVGRLNAMIDLAQAEVGISIPVESLDSNPWLLACKSGVIDLKTGRISKPTRDLYITKVSPVEYNPEATCPLFDAFIEQIFDNDQEMIDFVYRALGYSLTGATHEQVMFFAHGLGANGKSTLMSVVQYILGDYSRMVDSDILMQTKGDQHTTGLTDLKGLRFAIASETNKSNRFAEATIKKITGEEKITARRMRQDNMTFTANHKLWMLTNHRPIIKGNDEGIWRRIVYVPFNVVVPKERRDNYLLDKLKAEASGILNKLLAGCRAWQEQGLRPPVKAQEQVEDYKQEMDQLHEFFEDYCILGSDLLCLKQDLFEAYAEWCSSRRQSTPSYSYFQRLMKERGFGTKEVARVDGRPARIWRGVSLAQGIVTDISVAKDFNKKTAED